MMHEFPVLIDTLSTTVFFGYWPAFHLQEMRFMIFIQSIRGCVKV